VPCPYNIFWVGTRHCRLLYIIPVQPELILKVRNRCLKSKLFRHLFLPSSFFLLPSSFFLLPSSFFLLTKTALNVISRTRIACRSKNPACRPEFYHPADAAFISIKKCRVVRNPSRLLHIVRYNHHS